MTNAHDGARTSRGGKPFAWALGLTVLFVLASLLPAANVFSEPEHYLGLHTALEFISISVAAMVFALGRNLRGTSSGGRFVWLGAVFLAVGLVDFAHILSYPGMPVFVTPSNPEKAINFWLAARFIALAGLLALPFIDRRPWSAREANLATCGALGVAALCWWIGLFHPQVLPHTFVPGAGLTGFKLGAEYVLAGGYGVAALALIRIRRRKGNDALAWLAAAAWTLGLAELYFTLYSTPADVFNMLGHLSKVAASIMIYKAVFVSGVRRPQLELAREQALLRALIDSVPDLIAFKDVRGAYMGCNKAFSACYGVEESMLRGRTDGEVFGRGMQGGADGASRVLDAPERHEEWVEGKDGAMHRLDTLRIPFRSGDGKHLGEIGISRDFTERRRIHEQLAESERRLAMALDGAALGLWDWQIPSGKVVYSAHWARMLGYAADELAPDIEVWEALVHPDDWRYIRSSLEPHLRGETEAYSAEYRLQHKDGHWVWVLDAGRVLERDAAGAPLRAVGVHQDISQRKAMEESLLQLATSDPLTGLWNRRHFTEMVNGELGRVRRHHSEAALLLLDLDHFKRVNDTRGHAAGDEVLRHFSALIGSRLRDGDIFARLGGEEFAILLPCVDAVGAMRAADRFRRMIVDNPASVQSGPVPFSVSIGVSMLLADDEGFDSVFARADEALYAAKHGGRNRAVLSSPKSTSAGSAPESKAPAVSSGRA